MKTVLFSVLNAALASPAFAAPAPTDDQDSGIPECQYTFVRQSNLR